MDLKLCCHPPPWCPSNTHRLWKSSGRICVVPSGSTAPPRRAPPEGRCSPPAQQLSGVPTLPTFFPQDSRCPSPAPKLLLPAQRLGSLSPHVKQDGAVGASTPKGCSCCQSPASLSELGAAARAPPPRKARETVRALRVRSAGLEEPEGLGWFSSPSSAKATPNSPVLLQLARLHSSPIQQELTPP